MMGDLGNVGFSQSGKFGNIFRPSKEAGDDTEPAGVSQCRELGCARFKITWHFPPACSRGRAALGLDRRTVLHT